MTGAKDLNARNGTDDNLDELPPVKNERWRWVVLLVSSTQSLVMIGIYASAGVYMESMKEVLFKTLKRQ